MTAGLPGLRPFVSIVIPFKGTSDRLERLCAALAAQTYPRERMEVIVVDDASGAAVEEAVAPLAGESRPRVLQNCTTLGRARSRNLGAAAARGDVLVFIDGDDLPASTYIEAIAAHLAGDGPPALRTNMRVHPRLLRRSRFARFLDSRHVGRRLEAGTFDADPTALPPKYVSTNSLALRRSAFAAVGGFDEAFTAYGGEDEEFGLRLHAGGIRVAFAPEALIWDADDGMSLDRFCARLPEYVRAGLRRVVEKHPDYIRLSRYARLAYGEDAATVRLANALTALRRLGVIPALRWLLGAVDRIPWLPVPHRLYEVVIAAEVAAAAR